MLFSIQKLSVIELSIWWQLWEKWKKLKKKRSYSIRKNMFKFSSIHADLDLVRHLQWVYVLICLYVKSWVCCLKWPGVCALILRTCCCLSAVCWPKELSHNQGVKMLKSFQPTRLHGVFSPLLFIWHLVNHYYSRAPEGHSHTDAHTLKIRPAWTRTLRFTLDDNCLLTS